MRSLSPCRGPSGSAAREAWERHAQCEFPGLQQDTQDLERRWRRLGILEIATPGSGQRLAILRGVVQGGVVVAALVVASSA